MPITLPVKADPDLRSFERTANQAEKTFGRAGSEAGKAFAKNLDEAVSRADPKAVDKWTNAYDKVADAAGKVRVEEAKLADLRNRNASDARLISQSEALERARRGETRAMRDAGKAYADLTQSGNTLFSTLSNLSSGTRMGGIIGDVEGLASKFSGVGLAVGGTITAVAGLAIGIGAAASKLYELGSMWDDTADKITSRTGKIGADLDAMMSSVANVALDSSSSIGQIGDVLGRVSASIGATGPELENLTAYISDLNDMTGEQTNIKQLGMLFRVFKIDAEDQIPVLNQLYTSYTETQTPVNELIDTLVKAGPKFQQYGLDLGQTVSVLTAFNEAGVDPAATLAGLSKGLKAAADAGKDPKQVLSDVVVQIKALHDAQRDTEAIKVATDFFGAKNAPAFLEAIESGKLGVDQLNGAIQQQAIDIRDTRAATDDFAQEWQRFKNFLSVDLEPVATAVFGAMNQQLEWFTESMRGIIDGLKAAWQWAQDLFNTNAVPTTAMPGSVPGTPLTPGDIISGNGSAPGGNPLNPGGVYGPDAGVGVRGTPGRGFPMPWTLPALTGSGGIPAGRYVTASEMGSGDPAVSDLTRGLGDCSSAVEDLVNLMDGMPTAGREMATGNAAEWLASRGFQPGYQPGAFNVGFNDHHMQATLPDGRPFNWGSDASAGMSGLDGGTGALDPSFTQHYYRPVRTTAALSSRITPAASGGLYSGPGNSDFGPAYQPGPASAGATPGYDDRGNPGYYVPDPKQIRSANERASDVQDQIKNADQRIADLKGSLVSANEGILGAQNDQLAAIQKAAALDADLTASEAEKAAAANRVKAANDAVKRATEERDRIVNRDIPEAQKQRDRLVNRDLRDATEAVDEANKGRFRSAEKAPKLPGTGGSGGRGFGGSGQKLGAPIAGDFGLSGGLPGLAENVTNFLGNLAFAPALGALSGLSFGMDPTGMASGASGLFGMLGTLGMGGGSTVMAGGQSAAPNLFSGGGGGLGGLLGGIPGSAAAPPGAGGMFGSRLGAAPGPAMGGVAPTTLGGNAPGVGGGGAGFGGLGGLPMQALQTAASGLDALAPGASVAANIGIQLTNRAIAQGGKAAGLLVGGLMETFLPANSKLADPSANWFGKIAAGMAGAKPALPNMAGQPADKPAQADPMAGPAAAGGDKGGITVNYTNNQATEDRAGADLTNHLMAMNAAPGK